MYRSEKLAEAFATFGSEDNSRALVIMGELGQYEEVQEVSEEYKDAVEIEGEEILTHRPRTNRNTKNVRKH